MKNYINKNYVHVAILLRTGEIKKNIFHCDPIIEAISVNASARQIATFAPEIMDELYSPTTLWLRDDIERTTTKVQRKNYEHEHRLTENQSACASEMHGEPNTNI